MWNISVVDGQAKVFKNGAPLKSSQGEEYGILLDVSTKMAEESEKTMIQLKLEQDESNNKRALLNAKYFNHFKSSPPFHVCSSKETEKLAQELTCSLRKLKAGHHPVDDEGKENNDAVPLTSSSGANSDEQNTGDGCQNVCTSHTQHLETSTTAESQAAEAPVSTIQPPKRKRRLSFNHEVEIPLIMVTDND